MCRKPLTDVELQFSVTPYVEKLGMSITVEKLFFQSKIIILKEKCRNVMFCVEGIAHTFILGRISSQ